MNEYLQPQLEMSPGVKQTADKTKDSAPCNPSMKGHLMEVGTMPVHDGVVYSLVFHKVLQAKTNEIDSLDNNDRPDTRPQGAGGQVNIDAHCSKG